MFALIVFNDSFLLLFGKDFVQGGMALIILSLGQLINAATGPVGALLTMTGQERGAAVVLGAGATLNVLLSVILVPILGLLGAAIAAASAQRF